MENASATDSFYISNTGGSGASKLDLGGAVSIIEGGNVGIGTTNPDSKLHVASGNVLISNNQFYTAENTGGTNYKLAGLTSGNVIQIGAIDYTSASTVFAGGDNLRLTTGGASGTTRLYINSSGNVGIGTTNPSRGNLVVEGDFQTTASGNGQLAVISKVSGSDPAAKDIGGQMVFGGPISASDSHRTFGLVGGYKENNTSGDRAGYLAFGTRQNAGSRDIFERMRIDSIGNVGIGTVSPAYNLTIADALTSTPKTLLEFDANNITNGGGYNIDFRTSSNNTADRYVARIRGIREGDGAKSQLSFWTENSGLFQRMTIKADGNVGIGTTSPTAPLDVLGVRAGRDWSIANRATIRLDSNGTGSPSDILFG
eukprot:COSAG02_NODE_15553_length_1160_cov_4.970782_1_plen_369_part_01